MNCSFCNGKLSLILDMGEQALAGAFLMPPFDEEKKYPLKLCFCPDCYAVQVAEHIPPETLFKNYFYKTSAIGTMRKHFSRLAKKIKAISPSPLKVVEIGCNDGVLLKELASCCSVYGIDPSNVVEALDGVDIYNDFLNREIADKIGESDVVVACNVFAHISDINEATECVYRMLKQYGVFIMEVNYLPNLIEKLQYDWIYHEHLYYYSLLSLENHLKNHGLFVSHVEHLESHAGSVRFYISKEGEASRAVYQMREEELAKGYDKLETFLSFGNQVKHHCKSLNRYLNGLVAEGKTIAGYGACGRANTMIQYCGLEQLSYMIDDAPAKTGFYTPGSHYKIYNREVLGTQPDYILVFAWSFMSEIKSKLNGFRGKIVAPLPEIKELN